MSRRAVLLGGLAALPLTAGTLRAQAPAFPRPASTGLSRSIHSGHSLTDAYVHSGEWPGALRSIRNTLMRPEDWGETHVVKSTIPGAPLHWRWNHHRDLSGGDDARSDIGRFDTLMITEGGPPPRAHHGPDAEWMAETLDYLCRFTANAIQNGNDGQGALDIILWSIWPSLHGWPDSPSWGPVGDFRACLPEYGRSFKFMADYASWKMRQLYPALPGDWRVWLFPGHLWMARVHDDLRKGAVPGIRDMAGLFTDDIHPNGIAGYGLAALVATGLYQVELAARPRLHVEKGVSREQAAYFWQLAWQICRSYEPVGMGGTEGAERVFDPARDGDPLPGWTLAAAG